MEGRPESEARRGRADAPFRFRPRVFELPADVTPASALARLAGRRLPVLLDGPAGAPRRFSLLGFDPLRPAGGADPRPDAAAGIPGLRALLARLAPEEGDACPAFFAGGFLGALAYDLGVAGERLALPEEPWRQALLVGGLYTDFLVRDEVAGRTFLVLGEEPGDLRPSVAERRAELLELCLGTAPEPPRLETLGPLVRCVPSAEHARRIERARAAIAAGEIYQANLAHRFTRAVSGDPLALWPALVAANPAPYMGCVRWKADDVGGVRDVHGVAAGGALLSSSPELLLECDGRVARTRPIKGTIARAADPREDARARATLLASAKDRAELAMIVDLERNDLGRIARPGSVQVDGFPTLETHARVHHLVADVRAELAPGKDAVDALAALFPGGSVTGAPKLRAMEVIAELEGEGRGFVFGALGLLDTAGRACFNILIRTALWRPRPALGQAGGELSFRVGGGITWSSDAAEEDRESLAKAAAIADALDSLPARRAAQRAQAETR